MVWDYYIIGNKRIQYTSNFADICSMNNSFSLLLKISELQKELAELEKHNEELEDEVEMKKAAYMDEIADLEV